MSNKGFLYRVAVNAFIAVDQLLNTALMGHPDETISSRLGRTIGKERYFWVKPLRQCIDVLFWFDADTGKGHCESSILPLEQQTFRTFDYELWSWNKKE